MCILFVRSRLNRCLMMRECCRYIHTHKIRSRNRRNRVFV